MVASVAERGFQATTVNHLVEISGVSSRTFYDLYPDKRACFIATMEALVQMAIAYVAEMAGEDEAAAAKTAQEVSEREWEERAHQALGSFAAMIAAQPAASRLVMVESYAAGPEALVPLENAIAGFEWLSRQVVERSPERADMPPEMITALTGGVQEVVRNRLLSGHEGELPGMIGDAWQLLLGFRAPPEPLRLVGRPPKAEPESTAAHDHAERALRAMAAVVAEEGYAKTKVDAVVRRAQMSASTFYAHFDGKEDAMLAAIDSAAAQLLAATMPAYRRGADWPNGLRAAYGALFNFLASRPSLATLLMIEVYAAGPAAMQRRMEALKPLEALVAEGHELFPQSPQIDAEGILGAVYTLAYRRLRESGPDALPFLAPLCAYITLSPLIGAAEACRIANGDGRGRTR
jgi:AcrR family transcriptional regulator